MRAKSEGVTIVHVRTDNQVEFNLLVAYHGKRSKTIWHRFSTNEFFEAPAVAFLSSSFENKDAEYFEAHSWA